MEFGKGVGGKVTENIHYLIFTSYLLGKKKVWFLFIELYNTCQKKIVL